MPLVVTQKRRVLVVFGSLNVRSVNYKSLVIKDYVIEHHVDMALTETWLKPSSENCALMDLCLNMSGGVQEVLE